MMKIFVFEHQFVVLPFVLASSACAATTQLRGCFVDLLSVVCWFYGVVPPEAALARNIYSTILVDVDAVIYFSRVFELCFSKPL